MSTPRGEGTPEKRTEKILSVMTVNYDRGDGEICAVVHGCTSIRDEILVLLHSHYPDQIDLPLILRSLDLRHPGSVKARLRELYAARLIDGSARDGYRLAARGFDRAAGLVVALAA